MGFISKCLHQIRLHENVQSYLNLHWLRMSEIISIQRGSVMFVRRNKKIACIIGLDKSGYQVDIFLISPRNHMLWVLIRNASLMCF